MKLNSTFRAIAASASSFLLAGQAMAIDVDAGDYTALPPGTNIGLIYFQHATRDALYADGDKVAINPKLTSDIGVLRGIHYTEIGGYIVDPQFLLPFGTLEGDDDISSLGSNSGVADLILAATVWLNKADSKTHFGITPFLYVPIGQYDRNDPLSLGENRWKFALQVGYITPLSEKVTLDLIGDVTFHGENSEFGPSSVTMKQDPRFQLQGFLRYHLSPATDLRFCLAYSGGGETEVQGVSQDDRISTSKFNLGVAHFVGAKTQLLATYGSDISVDNGFKENSRVNLRLLQIF
jgi:hypothetical protein